MGDMAQEPPPILEVVDWTVAYGSRVVVDGIGSSVERGVVFGRLGPGTATRVSRSGRG